MANLSDLTHQESQILQLLVAGLTNKAIAAEMHICEKTVEFHLDKVYSKIGARSRLKAVLWAIEQGMRTEKKRRKWRIYPISHIKNHRFFNYLLRA